MEEKEEQEKPIQHKEKSLIEDFLGDIINLDRGLPATILAMIKSPDKVIDNYISHERHYVNPFRYTIFILAVTTFIVNYFIDYETILQGAMELGSGRSADEMDIMMQDIEDQTGFDATGYMDALGEVSLAIISKFNQLLYIIVLAPVLAFVSKLFFKETFKKLYVMFLYTLSTYAIFSLALIPLLVLQAPFWFYSVLSAVLMLFYAMYVQAKSLKFKGFEKYFQSGISFVLGYLVFSIVSAVVQYLGAFILFMSRS